MAEVWNISGDINEKKKLRSKTCSSFQQGESVSRSN